MPITSLQFRGKSLVFKKTAIAKLSLTDAQKKVIMGGGDTGNDTDPTTNCESVLDTKNTTDTKRCTTKATHDTESVKVCGSM